jgi:hypothetical protein
MDHSLTTDMANALTKDTVTSTTIEVMNSDIYFNNTSTFWYEVSQKLEKESNIVRTGK